MSGPAHTPIDASSGPAPGETDRILTVPNLVTFCRLLMLPVFLWVLFGRDDRHVAAWVLVAIGGTDWVDGYLARRLGQVSTVGKIIDPVADRLLFFVGIGAILVDGSAPVWVAVAVLVREVAVSVATLALAAAGAARIDVTWVGKAATFLLMGAFPSFLASNASTDYTWAYEGLAWAVTIPGLALSYYALAAYVPLGRKALAEGRAARAEAATGRRP